MGGGGRGHYVKKGWRGQGGIFQGPLCLGFLPVASKVNKSLVEVYILFH